MYVWYSVGWQYKGTFGPMCRAMFFLKNQNFHVSQFFAIILKELHTKDQNRKNQSLHLLIFHFLERK